ncbi:response regulator [Pedobacter sp. LMG 31464]|uniref:Response regulator n=1 Tax=Pedobacter planticolens TaxID=2679964 RepID=A0A923DVP2_9SPHI|nr:response regulator [Pedobacter planticolens]MBB2144797.1 response regulator [Pedobacter planticolens]
MKKRVLVVENNKDILELISLILDEAGYELSLYTNERNIFEHIVSFQPDAILLDIVRPTVEGTELCRQIKEAEGTSHIPVIVLSTHPQIERVKEVCADEVVPKPFDIDALLETLEEQLGSNN